MDSQINKSQVDKILQYIEIDKSEGARLVCGGKKIMENDLDKGNFISPTIFADATNDMRIAQEEIFFPVACIMPFDRKEEVIAMANDSEYGLAVLYEPAISIKCCVSPVLLKQAVCRLIRITPFRQARPSAAANKEKS